MKKLFFSFVIFVFSVSAYAGIQLNRLDTVVTADFGEGGAEIVAFDPSSNRLFISNAVHNRIDIVDMSDPSNLSFDINDSINISPFGSPNSVTVKNGLVAVAVEAPDKTQNGTVRFYKTDGTFIKSLTVGALPDMVTFNPSGNRLFVANEGEPDGDDYDPDPEGSVSIIKIPKNPANLSDSNVTTVGFTQFNNAILDPSIRIFGPGATVAQDLEPEYITVSDDSKTAWITLQENNTIAVLDVEHGRNTHLLPLGFKNHNIPGQGLDASDRDVPGSSNDGIINIQNWPVFGMYQPDAIANYIIGGQRYLFTANEGDSRDYDAFSEEDRVNAIELNDDAFDDVDFFQNNDNLGRLTITNTLGHGGDEDFEELYVFGARSFSIWTDEGQLAFDSGDDIEQRTATAFPDFFNSDNEENDSFDTRSDNKGPEPEAITVAEVYNSQYAFVGLERIGGIIIYDVSNPLSPSFVDYINDRDFTAEDPEDAGFLGPESFVFVHKRNSPTRAPLLITAHEWSGSVAVYEILKD